ncbi:NAD(P)H-hydrate dehydratase [Nitratireductor kimnyeongensis]|uniref:Bifunctional NAD(P)H-hydrate repair enzyme n=1 Tax=Nitratireductor kimnyeongensis TaxID=430679 RepID=A0ABW0TA66_9HYPH|nr:NAD(P)H-hydrate dehydratase [Nitratireductor kimnyeongensis]QZZ35562.1 NAD(P)H-hydrate dehydratase [Nitratireductor kimnyeongensis]
MHLEVVTPEEMGRVDRAAIAPGPHAGYGLMRNAGAAVAGEILARYAEAEGFFVLCGPGNNGGDGYVVARLLAERGLEVRVFADAGPATGSDAALALGDCPVKPEPLSAFQPRRAWLVVDALFGAGLKRPVEGGEAAIIAEVSNSGLAVVAIDLPTGLCGLTGKPLGSAFSADLTVTFFRKKRGHLLVPGRQICGDLVVADIGIADSALHAVGCKVWENQPPLWRPIWPKITAGTHKYSRGHVAVVSGGAITTGAARLSALAAARAGAGAVTVLSPANALSINAMHLTSIMLRKADTVSELQAFLVDRKPSGALLGPGAGTGGRTRSFARALLDQATEASGLVFDADAITAFRDRADVFFGMIRASAGKVVLTPHEGEFARLFPELQDGTGVSKVQRAQEAAERSGATLVLKGFDTIVAAPDGRAAINVNATPHLATAGSGDVLSGIIASLMAQGMPAFEAACAGVWVHAESGRTFGYGLVAEDLPDLLPEVLQRLFYKKVTPSAQARS